MLAQNDAPEAIESVLNGMGKPSVIERTSPQAIAAAVGILPDLPVSVLGEAGIHGLIRSHISFVTAFHVLFNLTTNTAKKLLKE